MATRYALCGHTYDAPFARGRARKFCEACSAPKWNNCRQCGAVLEGRRSDTVFCDANCRNIHVGVKLASPLSPRTCALEGCEVVFTPYRNGQRCCSERHGKNLYNRESRADGRQVHPGWTDKRRDHWHRRRAVKLGASTGRPVIRDEIALRDNYTCGICGLLVEMTRKWPDPLSPSLDHIQPLQPFDGSEPGLHDPDNVQLAHVSCNASKNNRPLSSLEPSA